MSPLTFRGLPVVPHRLVPSSAPKLSMSPHMRAVVGDAFFEEMDAWLLRTFGERRVAWIMEGMVYVSEDNYLAMRAELAQREYVASAGA